MTAKENLQLIILMFTKALRSAEKFLFAKWNAFANEKNRQSAIVTLRALHLKIK
ncbi:protein of unknown function [Chryseobacterium sp. JV274]|nr:protein of unknown function [Chryseobacterium sp. JV274]